MRGDTPGEWEDETQRDIESLKADCEVRRGRPPGLREGAGAGGCMCGGGKGILPGVGPNFLHPVADVR
jgi:hypothetical protein